MNPSSHDYTHRNPYSEYVLKTYQEKDRQNKLMEIANNVSKNTTFHHMLSGQKLSTGDTYPLTMIIAKSSSILKDWKEMHDEKHHVHFSFDEHVYTVEVTADNYKIARTRVRMR